MKIDKNDFFRQATMCICGTLDLGEALQRCLNYLHSLIPADVVMFNTYDPGLNRVKTHILKTHATVDVSKINFPQKTALLSPQAKKFIETQSMPHFRLINNFELDPVGKDYAEYINISEYSALVMYLAIGDMKIGNISIGALGKNRYNDEHLSLFSMLNEPFAIALSNILRFQEVTKLKDMLVDDNRYFQQELRRLSGDEIIGSDIGLKNVMEMVREVAPVDSPVLLLGETGVGKDVIANAIHTLSRRRDGPFIKLNCGAIPETLIDSELFGHEEGAFTGATKRKRGCFERADQGTIFLDEVGELPLQARVRMLRVLQAKEIERVGGTHPIKLNIRIIAATNQNLQNMTKTGRFRSDLWFRLHIFPIMIPPLRERKFDIPALVNYFIDKKEKEMRLPTTPKLAKGAIERLMAYSWPGNVRELENVLERALILCKDQSLTFHDMIRFNDDDHSLDTSRIKDELFKLDLIISRHIRNVLKHSKGKVNGPGGAADLLGLNPSTLRYRMKTLGIPFGRRMNDK